MANEEAIAFIEKYADDNNIKESNAIVNKNSLALAQLMASIEIDLALGDKENASKILQILLLCFYTIGKNSVKTFSQD